MKFILSLFIFIFCSSAFAKDSISKKIEFLWKLDTAQVETQNSFILAHAGIIKDQIFLSHLENVMPSSYDSRHFYAATYKDEQDTYAISLDFTGKNHCNLSINSNKDYTDIVYQPIDLSYCENLLGFEYKHYMTNNLKFVFQRLYFETIAFYVRSK